MFAFSIFFLIFALKSASMPHIKGYGLANGEWGSEAHAVLVRETAKGLYGVETWLLAIGAFYALLIFV